MLMQMGRVKTNIELIQSRRIRYLTYEKRKNSIKKKAYELSTLCDVQVGIIIYGPQLCNKQPLKLDEWPRNEDNKIPQLLNKYKAQPADEIKRRTSNLSDYFKDRENKAQADVQKMQQNNEQALYPAWDKKYDSLSGVELMRTSSELFIKLKDAKVRQYNHLVMRQQKMWLEQQRSSFNDFLNKINPHEFDEPYNVQHGISTFDHPRANYVTPIRSHDPLNRLYAYQQGHSGYGTFGRAAVDLVPNKVTWTISGDYAKDTGKNIVNGAFGNTVDSRFKDLIANEKVVGLTNSDHDAKDTWKNIVNEALPSRGDPCVKGLRSKRKKIMSSTSDVCARVDKGKQIVNEGPDNVANEGMIELTANGDGYVKDTGKNIVNIEDPIEVVVDRLKGRIAESLDIVNKLIKAPEMSYNGEALPPRSYYGADYYTFM